MPIFFGNSHDPIGKGCNKYHGKPYVCKPEHAYIQILRCTCSVIQLSSSLINYPIRQPCNTFNHDLILPT